VRGSDTAAGVAVKILVEENAILEPGILRQLRVGL
jgi:hypothetical protein